MDYLEWNNKIASRFFNPEQEGRRVFLCVTEDLIKNIGGNDGIRDFVDAVKTGPEMPDKRQRALCSRPVALCKHWIQSSDIGIPPYVGYLGFFVLATGFENMSGSEGYHKRLRELVGEEVSNQPLPGFYDLWEVWCDLERWANETNCGRLGIFVAEITKSWAHVRLPISQTLLTESERKMLPQVFLHAGFDPSAPPSDEEVALGVRKHGVDVLMRRTIRRLTDRQESDTEFRSMLIETILDELRECQLHDVISTSETGITSAVSLTLRISLRIDGVANVVETQLRMFSEESIGDGWLSFNSPSSGLRITCSCEQGGWSFPVKTRDGILNGSFLDWKKGDMFTSEESPISLKFSGKSYRLFGSEVGLPYLIEVNRLPLNQSFWMAMHEDVEDDLNEWGHADCEGWTELSNMGGLPKHWLLYKAERAVSTTRIQGKYPGLCLPTHLRLYCEGGLRIGRGNVFLDLLPPKVRLEGPFSQVHVSLNNTDLGVVSCGQNIVLPLNQLQQRNVVEASDLAGHETRKGVFFLVKGADISWQSVKGSLLSGSDGLAAGNNTPTCQGSVVVPASSIPSFPANAARSAEDAVLVGRQPGQVISVSGDAPDWPPVWVISKGRRKRRVAFCGIGVDTASPFVGENIPRKSTKQWKELLYHQRRQMQPPSNPRLASLWRQYQKAAKNA